MAVTGLCFFTASADIAAAIRASAARTPASAIIGVAGIIIAVVRFLVVGNSEVMGRPVTVAPGNSAARTEFRQCRSLGVQTVLAFADRRNTGEFETDSRVRNRESLNLDQLIAGADDGIAECTNAIL